MEKDLFVLNLKAPELIGLVNGNIGRSADGSSSHFASALKFGLKRAVDFKRGSKGVRLQCTSFRCINPVWYSSAGSSVFCSYCSNSQETHYTYCAGCITLRGCDSVFCEGCGNGIPM